jgi:8-oxo-dGTP diphosphatase
VSEPLLVAAAVVVDHGQVLACRRRPGLSSAGRWEFPGGKVESGELPAEAVVRELHEELGVEVRATAVLWSDDTDLDGRVIRLVTISAELVGGRPVESTDHDRLEWLSPTDLLTREWAAPDLPAVRRLVYSAQSIENPSEDGVTRATP